MELFRAGEAMLRSPQPLLPFLAPAVYRTPIRAQGGLSRIRQARAISSTRIRHQEEVQKTSPDRPDFSDLLGAAFDGTKGTPAAPASRTPNFKSSAEQQQRRDFPDSNKISFQDSIKNILDDFQDVRTQDQEKQSRTSFATRSNSLGNLADFLNPNKSIERTPPPPPPQPAPFRLNSTVGRTVDVNPDRGMDVGRAFRALEMKCNQNSVKRDFMRQRFHEREGLKRKRLKRERWRRRFKEMFQGTVKMVEGMRKQGW